MNVRTPPLMPQPTKEKSLSREENQHDFPLPFLLRFLEPASPIVDGQPTAGEPTPHQTGLDNKFVDDTMEDEDEDNDPRPDKTGVIADSSNKEDEDY
jgi:hypothetical protein